MKKTLTLVAVVAAALALWGDVLTAQDRGKATLRDGGVTIDYGRPSVQGRDVMSMIAPGSYWRMGSNAATTLRTNVDLKFGQTVVPTGFYTLVAHFVEPEKWNLVIAKEIGQGSKPVDIAGEVPGRFEKDQPNVEQLTIDLKEQGNKATFTLSWGTYRLSADFEIGS